MTGSATAEADDEDFVTGGVLILLLVFTIIVDVAGLAFIYKVWNERVWRVQVREDSQAQTAQLKRVADAFDFFAEAHAAKRPVRLSPKTAHFEVIGAGGNCSGTATTCGEGSGPVHTVEIYR